MNFSFLVLSVFLCINVTFAQNAIVTENLNAGVPASAWDIPGGTSGDQSIQGFATDISVNKGGTMNFKINVSTGTDKNFGIKIYRIGYYQGNGARQIADLGTAFTGIAQNGCSFNGTTGLTDCGNWTTTASWTVPATAVSGIYLAKLTRSAAGGGGSSHIVFIVRDDASTSALYFKTSDATWQAYNPYGGTSLYVGDALPNAHASKVSYNRPFLTRDGGGGGGAQEDWFMNAEYPMIRFLERNGYDISYTTDVDISRNATNLILNHKVFLSVGHDEYWSKPARDAVEAAKAAGKNLAFFSGNEVYWKTRWENSVDGTNTTFRTLVCYKEGTATPVEKACGDKCDLTSPEWTGLWRTGCGEPGGNACKPENALTGQISWDGNTDAMQVPGTYKNLRFWRNTPDVANLPINNTYNFPFGTLGYEWDWEQFQSSYPPGRVTMSSTTSDGHTHKLSLYKAPSGAIVFGAGTVQWSWGLDENHDINEQGGGGPPDQNIQQATVNVLADMGAQPATLQSPLSPAIASTDATPPASVITNPANGTSLPQGIPFIIKGTATDVGGVVAGVDISVDGGVNWQPANGTSNWTYSWVPSTLGSITIISRSYDDIGNLESTGGSEGGSLNSISVIVENAVPPTNCPCTIFNPTTPPIPIPQNIDLNDEDPGGLGITTGVKFKPSFDGFINGIWFYQAASDNSSIHKVALWNMGPGGTSSGTQIDFKSQTTTTIIGGTGGWREIMFDAPIPVVANTVYVATNYSPSGYYTSSDNAFLNPVVNGPLTIIADGDQGPNGLYEYSDSYPENGYNGSNYWVDVDYTNGPDLTPPSIVSTTPLNNAANINVNSFINANFSETIDPTTVNSTNVQLKNAANVIIPADISYVSSSRTISIIPLSSLSFSSLYKITILGAPSGIRDLAGNLMTADYSWNFTTSAPPAIPPDEGNGGPLLVISNRLNIYSRYMVEILRAQGYTAFRAMDISEVTTSVINQYDVVLLGSIDLSGPDVTMLTNWVTAGGILIAQRPPANLLPLMGVTANGATPDKYMRPITTAGMPGFGFINQSIQFHGSADQYTRLAGTSALAMIYTPKTTVTVYPAVTTRNVGSNGGKAIAFAYDLAKSVITTRQGNPALEGMSFDGQSGPVRSDNLFFGGWLDFNNVQIPQADEQQHFLTNIILQNNLAKKPLPHLWFLPNGLKAAVVMTGDDHNLNYGTTQTRFAEYMTLGPNSPTDVADWKAIRGTSYIFNGTPIPDDSVTYYQQQGFEIGLHPTTNCINFTAASLSSNISTQLSDLHLQLPTLLPQVTNRTHCLPWSDWSSQPSVESLLGIHFDVNYYYWPGTFVQNRPGLFTGSGMPMKFSDLDGNILDCYQAPTQITDESGQDIPLHINTLLDNALDATKQYFGVFTMNMHTDLGIHPGSDAITDAAILRGIPVVSSKQMLEWLDNRNNTAFSVMNWDNLTKRLSFHLSTQAHNLQTMVPINSADGALIQVLEDGINHNFSVQSIKGIAYGFFSAKTADYVAIYSSTPLPITLTNFTAVKEGDDARLNWSTSMETNNKGFEILRSTDETSWDVIGFIAGAGNSQTNKDYVYLDLNLPAGTYYYRLRQVDYDSRSTLSKIIPLIFGDGMALELMQNRPNPFNNNTTIVMVIPRSGRVQLVLYDQMGRPLQQLVDENKMPGTYNINMSRNGLSSGVYYYKMSALGQTIVKKMTVL